MLKKGPDYIVLQKLMTLNLHIDVLKNLKTFDPIADKPISERDKRASVYFHEDALKEFPIGYQFFNPKSDSINNLEIVCVPKDSIDGFWLIYRGNRLWNSRIELGEVLGVTPQDPDLKAYSIAKKLAEERTLHDSKTGYHPYGMELADQTKLLENRLLQLK